ncbi:hypothetical protein [Endozoicomonas sp.]|uniref:hypothetical protein n=1 Tax=Endozoicomonas sp. TaxID=1892382 RepID=UPI0028852624|nr:hypothetical protein [Endozoicomonas sp.]
MGLDELGCEDLPAIVLKPVVWGGVMVLVVRIEAPACIAERLGKGRFVDQVGMLTGTDIVRQFEELELCRVLVGSKYALELVGIGTRKLPEAARVVDCSILLERVGLLDFVAEVVCFDLVL